MVVRKIWDPIRRLICSLPLVSWTRSLLLYLIISGNESQRPSSGGFIELKKCQRREINIYWEPAGLGGEGEERKKDSDGTNNLFKTLCSRILSTHPRTSWHGFQRLTTPTTEMLGWLACSHLFCWLTKKWLPWIVVKVHFEYHKPQIRV